MKKLLAVILAALLVTSLLTVGVFAAYADDELDGTSFTAEVFEGRGLRMIGSPNGSLGKDFFVNAYANGYYDGTNDELKGDYYYGPYYYAGSGIGIVSDVAPGEGGVYKDGMYRVYEKGNVFTGANISERMLGGNWISGTGSVPFCRFPFNFDIDLAGKKEIAGIRIYTGDNSNGWVKAYDVYVKYTAEDADWHYICSGNTNAQADLTSDFGFNITVAKVRISVTDISNKTGAAIMSTDGKMSIPKGAPNYFYIKGIRVLKSKDSYVNATVEQKDDEIAIDAAKLTGYLGGKVREGIKQLMDGNIGNKVILNGNTTLDFGQQVTFSGFRYYPHVGATANDVVKSFGIDGGVKIYSELGDEGSADTLLANAERISLSNADIDYTAAGGGTDYTQSIDVDFGKNVTARGINFHIYHVPGKTEAASPYAGEIRLLAAKDYSHGYALKDDVVEFGVTPEVIDKGASKAGAGFVWNNPSCLFDGVIPIKDGDFGIDKNSSTYYVGFGTYGADAGFMSGEKAWLTIDLKQETDLSAVRLFGRMYYTMSPTDVNLYFSNDNVKWTLASHNTDSLNGKKIDDMFCYSKSGDIYTDMKPNDGDSNYSVRARYIKIEILKAGNSDYAALSEIMLVKPGNNVLSVDELNKKIAENSVKLEITSAESGIYPATEATAATGIIRFITKFNDIKEGTTVEEFGTYVITNENYNKNSDLSRYSDAFASYKNATPEVGDAFSVDVTNIAETNWNTPVVAISFVKIEGYNNLIISGIKLLDKVDSANELSK